VYPREIEAVLHEHPAVVDCAVFGVPDERHGEVLVAVVETRTPASEDELLGHVGARLADFKRPAAIHFVTELPRDPNGKVMKRFLRDSGNFGRPTEPVANVSVTSDNVQSRGA
jgi:acyl-CoA synthetase (AMP-forming)/AMP-acid ligase II